MPHPTFKEFLAEAKQTAWVILYTPEKLILGKRSPAVNNPNTWGFVGGTVDPEESAEAAATREAKEEVGIKINPSALKKVAEINGATYFSYKVSGFDGMKTTKEVSKIAAFKLVDLPDNMHFKAQNFFDRLDHLL